MKIKIHRTLLAERMRDKNYTIKDGKVYPDTFEDIPFAGDPDIDDDMKVVLPQPKPTLSDLIDDAMLSFSKWFRSLDTEVRYGVEQRIKRKVCKDLSLNELEGIMSRFQAAMKGWSAPENKNTKPK